MTFYLSRSSQDNYSYFITNYKPRNCKNYNDFNYVSYIPYKIGLQYFSSIRNDQVKKIFGIELNNLECLNLTTGEITFI